MGKGLLKKHKSPGVNIAGKEVTLINSKAFTFVELIISTLIISILAAGMFGAFVGAQYFFNQTRHRMQAFNFAREAMDRLRSNYEYGDDQMREGAGHLENEIGSIIKGEMTNLNSELTYDVTEPEADGYRAVTVRVSWDETSF